MDASTRVLGIDNIEEVLEFLEPVATRWMWIGIALKLRTSDLEVIDVEFQSVDDKLFKMTKLWLKQAYNTYEYGLPTWHALKEAVRKKVGGNDPALANKIESLIETQPVVTEERYGNIYN